MAVSDRPQSEFNMAISYLNRLNQWFYTAGVSALDLDAHTWFHTLRLLYRELENKASKAELQEMETLIKEISSSHIPLHIRDRQKNQTNQIRPELYDKLEKFEIILRRVVKNAGLEIKIADDPSKSLMA